MIRYYCSGFDVNNAFGHGLGDMFKSELRNNKSIVYIPGGIDKIDKATNKYVPIFTKHFENVGINFENINILTSDTNIEDAKKLVDNASFLMLMGGDPFSQKELCEKLEIIDNLKNYKGVMLGFSAGAMLMSKYIIITPCSEEYPDFRIEEGLNLDDISIYPHNNTSEDIYPDILDIGGEKYKKQDLIKVGNEYGEFYLLQDNITDISIIKSIDGNIEYYTENNGKIWIVNQKVELLKAPSNTQKVVPKSSAIDKMN